MLDEAVDVNEAVEAVEKPGAEDAAEGAVQLTPEQAAALLTPEQAIALLDDDLALEAWGRANKLPGHQVVSALLSRANDWTPPPPVRGPDVRRPDTVELRDFVQRAVRLPERLRQVAALCLEQGLTLAECAARLGISRETVRVHLRRLRAIRRMAMARTRVPGAG